MFLHLFATLNTPRCKFRQCFPASMAAASDPGSWTSQWEKRCHIAFKICYVPQKNHELSQTVGFMMFYAEITPQRQASTARNFWGCCTTSKCAATFSAQKCQTCRVSQVSPWSMVGIKCTNFLRFAQCCPVLHGVACACHGLIFFQGHAFADEMEMQERHWHLDGNLYHC